MNIVAKIVGMSLKRWFAGPRPIEVRSAQTARARIPREKCLRLLPLEALHRAVLEQEAAAVDRVGILAERVNEMIGRVPVLLIKSQ